MNGWMYFLFAALTQQVVLTTGLGSALSLRLSRHPSLIWQFGGLQTAFAAAAAALTFPIDRWLAPADFAKWLRPLVMIAAVAVLYLLVYAVLCRLPGTSTASLVKLLPVAAFNNVTVGVMLIVNHQFAIRLPAAIGLAAGASVGLTLLSLLIGALRRITDRSEVPIPFRGLPLLLVCLGLLALGLCGFASSVSFI